MRRKYFDPLLPAAADDNQAIIEIFFEQVFYTGARIRASDAYDACVGALEEATNDFHLQHRRSS